MPRRNKRRTVEAPHKGRTNYHNAPKVFSPSVTICPTGKRGFPQHIAEAKLELYSDGTNRRTSPQRVYECDHCGAFHLTSQPLRSTS